MDLTEYLEEYAARRDDFRNHIDDEINEVVEDDVDEELTEFEIYLNMREYLDNTDIINLETLVISVWENNYHELYQGRKIQITEMYWAIFVNFEYEWHQFTKYIRAEDYIESLRIVFKLI